jgi:signal transduction histidine kinase
MASSKAVRRTSLWDLPLGTEHASGVGRASHRTDVREPVSVEKDEPLRMLLVEDSDDDAELVVQELRRAGYLPTLKRVATHVEFTAALEASPWDVIVSDYAIPGYGGLAALADLRASGLDIPFILVSGTIGEAVAVEAMRAGAQDYVLKQDLTRLPVAIARERRESAIRADREKMREQMLISERMASAGMLAAGVAHEINNSLAVAVSNVDFIGEVLHKARAVADADPAAWDGARKWVQLDEAQNALRDAGEGLRCIRDIVGDVKLFSRPLDNRAGTLDIRKVCDSSARMAWNEIRHRASLVKRYGEVPPIEANESRVGQVILNLLVNAAQAMPEGHADINEIRVATRQDEGGWAVVEVSDTGSGIAPQNLERIFDPFFTTKPVGVGTGLGLALCRRIVDELGGRIEVQSEVGRGTTFRVAFPPAPGTRKESRPSKAAPAAGRRARVLLVDDEVAMGAAVQRILSSHHDVVFVHRASEALARLAGGERFDVILCDFMMPEMTGMELHQRLEQLHPDQAKRIVFLTGGVFAPAGRLYLDGVSNLVLDKPFRGEDLLSIIDDVKGANGGSPGARGVGPVPSV